MSPGSTSSDFALGKRPRLDPATGAIGRVLESDKYVTGEASVESDVRVIWSSEDGSVVTTLAQATV